MLASTVQVGRRRYRRGVATAGSLDHPNVATVYEAGDATNEHGEARPFVVMELVDGEGLDVAVRRHPLPRRRAALLVATLADALDHVHENGIVHRDVKVVVPTSHREDTLNFAPGPRPTAQHPRQRLGPVVEQLVGSERP